VRRGFWRRRRRGWDDQWQDEGIRPAWLEDGPRGQVRAAREAGWIAPGSSVIDLGCGVGNTAAWLASLDHRVLAVDISEAAIERARRQFAAVGGLELAAGDVGRRLPATGPFDVVLDLGCLHQLPVSAHEGYGANVRRLTAPGSRLLYLMRFWGADADPTPEAKAAMVLEILGPDFDLEHAVPTELQASGVTELRPGAELRFVRRP
jgi:SAM-dependent methyltransferase